MNLEILLNQRDAREVIIRNQLTSKDDLGYMPLPMESYLEEQKDNLQTFLLRITWKGNLDKASNLVRKPNSYVEM